MTDFQDLSNIVLDDNSKEVIPEGDYRFTVDRYEVGFATSDKFDANTQQITCYLTIPIMKDGAVKNVELKRNLYACKKMSWAIRQFAECVGQVPEKGQASINIPAFVGLSGMCQVSLQEGTENQYNRVESCYPPSKAPIVAANDDAWAKKDDFMDMPKDLDDPFI